VYLSVYRLVIKSRFLCFEITVYPTVHVLQNRENEIEETHTFEGRQNVSVSLNEDEEAFRNGVRFYAIFLTSNLNGMRF
jgi:hypothetical protein